MGMLEIVVQMTSLLPKQTQNPFCACMELIRVIVALLYLKAKEIILSLPQDMELPCADFESKIDFYFCGVRPVFECLK